MHSLSATIRAEYYRMSKTSSAGKGLVADRTNIIRRHRDLFLAGIICCVELWTLLAGLEFYSKLLPSSKLQNVFNLMKSERNNTRIYLDIFLYISPLTAFSR